MGIKAKLRRAVMAAVAFATAFAMQPAAADPLAKDLFGVKDLPAATRPAVSARCASTVSARLRTS